MDLAESCVRAIITDILQQCPDDVAFFEQAWIRAHREKGGGKKKKTRGKGRRRRGKGKGEEAKDSVTEKIEEMTFSRNVLNPAHVTTLMERIASATPPDPYPRITYTEAISLLEGERDRRHHFSSSSSLSSNPRPPPFAYPVKWGLDLQSEHERWLCETHFRGPVFVTDYPASIKPFYMRLNDDDKNDDKGSDRTKQTERRRVEGHQVWPGTEEGDTKDFRTVAAFDLLFPGVGELIGGSQREERLGTLETRMGEMIRMGEKEGEGREQK